MTLTDALRAPSEATSHHHGDDDVGDSRPPQIGRGYSVGPSQIGMVGARVSRAPWLWSGPRKTVYTVTFEGGDPVAEAKGARQVVGRRQTVVRTLPGVVAKAGNPVGVPPPTDTGKKLVWVSR